MYLSKSDIIRTITILKGIAISLVVFLHWNSRSDYDCEIYNHIGPFLMPFRMPVFIFASGFLYFYVTKNKYPDYSKFILEKGKRLLIPLFSFKLIYFFTKYAAGFFISGDFLKVDTRFESFIKNMLVYPANPEYAGFLWFVYTLFIVFAIVHLISSNLNFLVFVSLIIFFIPLPPEFCLNSVGNYLFFFSLGGVLYKYLPVLKITKQTIRILFIVQICSISLITILFSPKSGIYMIDRLVVFFQYLCGVLFVLSLSVVLSKSNNLIVQILTLIGTFSASIYFLHTISCRVFALIGNHLFNIDSNIDFWLYLVFAINIGTFLPILLDKYIISKSNLAGIFLLGKKNETKQTIILPKIKPLFKLIK